MGNNIFRRRQVATVSSDNNQLSSCAKKKRIEPKIFKVIEIRRMKYLKEMIDILNFGGKPIFDDYIVKIETHTNNSYANTMFGYSDEIRILKQYLDLYMLLYECFLYIKGKLTMYKKKNEEVNDWETITLRSCLMNFDMNSTVWRLIATEMLE
ncbi:hypothetical protein RF55_9303 [Lasius niger]|uniref:Uncharacterized protein n=1 Tax=Lasius niger TaxID=67767 RepID=A0A0J7KKX1_LASNI|nr:hypothetical protein RF55_9303 [Lasius niger]